MASLAYMKGVHAGLKADLDFDTGGLTFKVMLVTSSYVEDKDHDFRNDITNEVSGTNYTAGGEPVTVSVSAIDTTNDRVEISLGGTSWPTSTITAAGAVYYVSRGGASSADELIAFNDFGGNVTSTAGTFTLNASTLRIQF
jgi:hypothetical protein